jgi:hypothetical protein
MGSIMGYARTVSSTILNDEGPQHHNGHCLNDDWYKCTAGIAAKMAEFTHHCPMGTTGTQKYKI